MANKNKKDRNGVEETGTTKQQSNKSDTCEINAVHGRISTDCACQSIEKNEVEPQTAVDFTVDNEDKNANQRTEQTENTNKIESINIQKQIDRLNIHNTKEGGRRVGIRTTESSVSSSSVTQLNSSFYLITLHSSKKNAALLNKAGNLRYDAKRNIDYLIIPEDAWKGCKTEYDIEVKVKNVYEVFISFSCNGISYKNLYVHGVERIFDVIQTLFVNKAFDIEYFRKMFMIKHNTQEIEPTLKFEYFGENMEKVVLSVEKRLNFREKQKGENKILESSFANDIAQNPYKQPSRSIEDKMNELEMDITLYESIYTVRRLGFTGLKRTASQGIGEHQSESCDCLKERTVGQEPEEDIANHQIKEDTEKYQINTPNTDLVIQERKSDMKEEETSKTNEKQINSNEKKENLINSEDVENEGTAEASFESTVYLHRSVSVSCPDLNNEHAENTEIATNLINSTTAGIPNIGNSCYMNTGLQCLNNLTHFSNFFFLYNVLLGQIDNEEPFLELYTNKEYKNNAKLIAEWSGFVKGLKGNGEVAPRIFKEAFAAKNSAFDNSSEQDVAEFIEALLRCLHEGLCYNQKKFLEFMQFLYATHKKEKQTASSLNYEKKDEIDEKKEDVNEQKKEIDEINEEIKKQINEKDDENIKDNNKDNNLENTLNTQNSFEYEKFKEAVHKYKRLGFEKALEKNSTVESEFTKLISQERSIISELFYGMFTNVLECQDCKYKKYKNDLVMFLPLPIPNKMNYHCSCSLMTIAGAVPIKILVPLSYTIREAIEYTKVEHDLKNGLLAVEYVNDQPRDVIGQTVSVSSIKNRIVFYEYSPAKKYVLAQVLFTKYFVFARKLATDFLLEHTECQYRLYEKLQPCFSRAVSFEEFQRETSIKRAAHSTVLNIPTYQFHMKDIGMLNDESMQQLNPRVQSNKDDISLTDCINCYFSKETVELRCEGCSKTTQYTMQPQLAKAPKYLVVHLKRFNYCMGNTKINTFIDFPENCLKLFNVRYRLNSTANHLEIGMGYGHYIAYIKKDGEWSCCNDSVISKAIGPDKSTAYVLFYERID